MKTILDRVVIFAADDQKRQVVFKEGLNIISGDSKTGKSALIEIVDYCLFSSRSTIPKGVITSFGHLYVVILRVGAEFIVIGRPGPDSIDSSKCFFSIETDKRVLQGLNLAYFHGLNLRPRRQAQAELEAHIGLSVSDTSEERRDGKKDGKASLRNMTSFLFQHQNLVANKHAIFYRFDDNSKRNATIEEWPIFMGWVDGTYYSLRRQLSEIERDIRAEERIAKSLSLKSDQNRSQLRSLLEEYCSIVGLRLQNDISYERLLVIANDLPDLPDIKVGNAEAIHKLREFESERDKLVIRKQEIEEQLELLSACKDASVSYAQYLGSIYNRSGGTTENNLCCPLCHNAVLEVNEKVQHALDARSRLEHELNKLGGYNVDNSESVESLLKERAEIETNLRPLNGQISRLNEYNAALKTHADRKALANRYRGRIEWVVKEVLDATKSTKARESLDELRDKKRVVEAHLDGYDISHKYAESSTLIAKYMNDICSNLDFEDELKPPMLRLDTKSFDFYHLKDKSEQIRLYEMGSGANWLACHLSLFLGLLWYSCFEKNTSIPKFLFLDQPSQVYFPKGDEDIQAITDNVSSQTTLDEDENIKQVKNIFTVVKTTISEIFKDTGVMPQVILTEHADPVKLGLKGFDNDVIKRWASNGEKLI